MIVAFGATAILIFSAGPGSAQKEINARIRKVYNLDRRNGDCRLCHIYVEVDPRELNPLVQVPRAALLDGKMLLNSFGWHIALDPAMKPLLGRGENAKFTREELDIVEKVVRSIEDEDTDGDGATNREELDLGTNPGDITSVPSAIDLAHYRKEYPPRNPLIAAIALSKAFPVSAIPAPVPTIQRALPKGNSFPIEYPVSGALILAFAIIGYTKWRAAR